MHILERQWCCLICWAKFRFKELRMGDMLECPVCHSGWVVLADGSVQTTDSMVSTEGWTRQ